MKKCLLAFLTSQFSGLFNLPFPIFIKSNINVVIEFPTEVAPIF
jgi:hypothetical protein